MCPLLYIKNKFIYYSTSILPNIFKLFLIFFLNKYLHTFIKYCNYFFIFAYSLKKPNSMKLNKANIY